MDLGGLDVDWVLDHVLHRVHAFWSRWKLIDVLSHGLHTTFKAKKDASPQSPPGSYTTAHCSKGKQILHGEK